MPAVSSVHWVSAARTDIGKVRKLNEDAWLARPGAGIWAVADGMGGHHAGDYASARVMEALQALDPLDALDDLESRTLAALNDVNEHLFNSTGRTMGCTLVLLLSRGKEARVIWAGDSRVYRLRRGALELLTRDHSRVQLLIDQGVVDPEDAENHPDANVITRAVGVTGVLELDDQQLDVNDGDTYLLCSDGLYRYLTDDQIRVALGHGDCQRACDDLVDLAMTSAARDNLTAVVVRAELDDTAVRTRINPVSVDGSPGADGDPTVLGDGRR